MGGPIAVGFRNQSGEIEVVDGHTNSMCWFLWDSNLCSKPEQVMESYLSSFRKAESYLGGTLEGVHPSGYGLVFVDALPLATGGKLTIYSLQNYCSVDDASMMVSAHYTDSTRQMMKELFEKFPANLLNKNGTLLGTASSIEEAESLKGSLFGNNWYCEIKFPTRNIEYRYDKIMYNSHDVANLREALTLAKIPLVEYKWDEFIAEIRCNE
jgi:hypothetical protein